MIKFVNATVCAALVASVAFGFAPTGVLAQEGQGNNLSSTAQPTSTTSVPAWQFLSRDALPGQAKNADQAKSQALPLQLNAAEMFAMTPGAEAVISLPGAATYTAIFERAEQHGGGIASWVGYLQEFGKDYRVLITRGPNGTFGSVRIPGREFRIIPGSGHDWMVDMAQEQVFTPPIDLHDDVMIPPKREGVQPRSDPKFVPLPAKGGAPAQQDVPTPQVFIDLMIVYTAGLANHLGPNLMTRLNNLVAAANQSYIDSEVAITLRLVKTVMVNYSDVSDDGEALEDISPAQPGFNAAVFGGIESQRAAAGADMVALLRDGENFSGHGIAWISDSSPSSSYLYSVTTGCVAGCESVLIHELGHNMGNAHDRATTAFQAGGVASPPQGAFSYSFGNFNCATGLTCNPNLPPESGGCNSQPACASSNSNNFGTIMSYFNPTILKFSNPNITCTPQSGTPQPCGVNQASPNSSDNALSMNNMRLAISGIKPTVVGSLPGSLQFTANTFTGGENTGTLNFTVSRVGGSSGAVSVTHTTANGSAISDLDHGGGSGTLNWANGDAANKTISIPLVNDGVTEGSETFTITLSNPAGATGVYLGSPSVATGVISEPWPAGGVMPSGFATPAGSSGAWTVVSDQVYEGTGSMRSAQVFGNMTSYVNSDLSFTGNFAASTLAFAYRVSSYQNYGVFDFIVDGATVFSDTGETGWKTFSSQLTAGSHTLTWRFRNRLSSACNNPLWNPPPDGLTACADRAWIDAVSLPLVLAASSTNLISSANPSRLNRSVSFTATVSGSAGTPSGNVIFKDNGATIAGCSSIALSSGSAVCATSALTLGSHGITAQYSGNSTYVTSTSGTVTQTVNPAGSGVSMPVMMLLLD